MLPTATHLYTHHLLPHLSVMVSVAPTGVDRSVLFLLHYSCANCLYHLFPRSCFALSLISFTAMDSQVFCLVHAFCKLILNVLTGLRDSNSSLFRLKNPHFEFLLSLLCFA